jgi:hypothetical protein
MPPRGVKSPKRKRQYEHIKTSARRRGTSERRAKEIAARTVNKERKKTGTSGKTRRQGSSSKKRTSKGGSRSRKRS